MLCAGSHKAQYGMVELASNIGNGSTGERSFKRDPLRRDFQNQTIMVIAAIFIDNMDFDRVGACF
jgi:hypothetical protein